jgi:hypothetical protein
MEQVPEPLESTAMSDMIYTTHWHDTTTVGPELNYTRATYWQQSTLRIPVQKSVKLGRISWYVRTIYRMLPEFARPEWYRIIAPPAVRKKK